MKPMKSLFRRNKNGAVMAEAALVLPILIGITFAITELGNILYISNSLNQLARTIARYASVSQTYTNNGLLTQSGASSIVNTSNVTLTISPAAGASRNVGDQITVTLRYAYTPIVNPYRLFNSTATWISTISSSAVSRSEVKQYP